MGDLDAVAGSNKATRFLDGLPVGNKLYARDVLNELAGTVKPLRSDGPNFQNAAIITDYAGRCRPGDWAFVGPGSEHTCKFKTSDPCNNNLRAGPPQHKMTKRHYDSATDQVGETIVRVLRFPDVHGRHAQEHH